VIKHHHPAYSDATQPTQANAQPMGRSIANYDPYEEELASEYGSEPDYEGITEARAERRRPDWDSDLRRH
jgi:hypothetical protein